jgi:pimeloyl-[acyl-carrier protein] methyl ester esterase
MTVVVLLPGMDGSGTLFGDFQSALGSRTIVVSYPPERALSYEQLESFVEKALPPDEPYILLGESFSGPIAIRLASKHLPGLRAVVLVCTFAKLLRNRPPRFIRALLTLLPFWRLPVSVGSAALLGRFDSPAIQSKLAAAIKDVAPAVWRIRLRSVLEVDVTSQLQRIQIPILYLRASEDRVVPAAASALVARINAGVKVVAIDGPHALLQTNPNACVLAIKELAQQVGITL